MRTEKHSGAPIQGKIWIDLDNSPHVPFFAPIIEELERRGYSVVLTVRDCFQVRDLANLFHLTYKRVGHHSGKNKILKLAGLFFRALRMAPPILGEKPDLALSHGSRAQLLLSAALGIPSITMFDYEFSKVWAIIHPTWVMVPDVIPHTAIKFDKHRILKYPGIKEDAYVPRFKPDPGIKTRLGLNGEELLITIRPPANEAHYHNPQSDELYHAVIKFMSNKPNIRLILLPRNEKQAHSARKAWPTLFSTGKIFIPDEVVDGLNLIWHSDLVISGGGTMNREAAALGVPVYSIFRGKIGSVDEYLANDHRLVLIESVQDVQTKIILAPRDRTAKPHNGNSAALQSIVDQIVGIMDSKCQVSHHKVQ